MPWHAFSARSPDAATNRLLHPERSPSPSSHTNIHWYDKRRTAATPNKKDAAHRHPSPVPFRNVVSWRWFMILANSLFTYTVNISTDIGQYTITSLSGYNRQKCYINAITVSTKDIDIIENTSLWCTDWKSIIYLYRPYGTWNRCFLGSWVINTDANGMTFSPPGQQQPWYGMRMGMGLVSHYEYYQLHIGYTDGISVLRSDIWRWHIFKVFTVVSAPQGLTK